MISPSTSNLDKFQFNFRLVNTIQQRKKTSSLIIENNENKFPIVIEKFPESNLKTLKESGFYVDKEKTLNEFKNEFLNEIFNEKELNELIFLTENNIEVNLKEKIEIIYFNYYSEEDNYLYLHYINKFEKKDFNIQPIQNNNENNLKMANNIKKIIENEPLYLRRKRFFEFKNKNKVLNRVPIVLIKDPNCKNFQGFDKMNKLYPDYAKMADFMLMIKQKLNLDPEDALFFLVNGKKIVLGDEVMGNIYKQYKYNDGLLYIVFSDEKIWG
jgi:microtubule-associated protein 1 light chain